MLSVHSRVNSHTEGFDRFYIKGKERFKYQVERLELRRDSQSRLRYIIVVLPRGSKFQFYQKSIISPFVSYFMSVTSDLLASLTSRPPSSAH